MSDDRAPYDGSGGGERAGGEWPPSLGARGGGWVALQFTLLGLALVVGLLDLSGWSEGPRAGLRYVGVLLISAAVVLAVLAAVGLGSALTALPRPNERGALQGEGVYGVVRHPMYTSVLVAVLGWSLVSSPYVLLVLGVLALVLDAKRQVEERWLLAGFPGYAAYRARVPWAFVPHLR